MRVVFAILADAASVSAEGKFSILGGDLGAIYVSNVPAMHPSLSLVVKLAALPEEAGHEHVFRVEVRSPEDASVLHRTEAPFTAYASSDDGDEASAGFVVNIIALILPSVGKYTIHLFVDAAELHTIPFWVKSTQPSTGTELFRAEGESDGAGDEVE
jgi:hypothetical protein